MSNVFSEALGYVLFLLGLLIVWWKFDWVIALAVGFLLYGFVLMLGGYIKVVTDIQTTVLKEKQ